MTNMLRHPRAMALAALMIASPAWAQVEPIQVIVPGEAPVASTSRKAVIEGLKSAEDEGAKNAWRVIKMRPDVALKVRNFTPDQNAAIVGALRSQCQVLMIDHVVDKKLKRVAGRFRYDCNQQDVIVAVDQQLRQTPHSAPDAGGQRPRIASFFLVKEVESMTTFDADIDRSNSASVRAGVTSTSSAVAERQSDERVRARGSETSRVAGTESWSESNGRLTEGLTVQERSNGALRVEARGKSRESATASVETVTSVANAEKQQGRTIHRAAVAKYRSASPEELNATLTDVLKNAGVRIVQYSDIQASCPGPSPDQIAREFGQKDEDLSSATRTAIVRAARACGFKYLVIGDALVDGSLSDPVSGAPRSSVVMRAKVWRIDEQIPEVLGAIQKEASAINSNVNLARANAVFQGAQRTGEEILARLTAEGVR